MQRLRPYVGDDNIKQRNYDFLGTGFAQRAHKSDFDTRNSRRVFELQVKKTSSLESRRRRQWFLNKQNDTEKAVARRRQENSRRQNKSVVKHFRPIERTPDE